MFLSPLKFEFLSHFQILETSIDIFFLCFCIVKFNILIGTRGLVAEGGASAWWQFRRLQTFLPVGGAKMSLMWRQTFNLDSVVTYRVCSFSVLFFNCSIQGRQPNASFFNLTLRIKGEFCLIQRPEAQQIKNCSASSCLPAHLSCLSMWVKGLGMWFSTALVCMYIHGLLFSWQFPCLLPWAQSNR